MKWTGIGLLALSAILIFVAIERYQQNKLETEFVNSQIAEMKESFRAFSSSNKKAERIPVVMPPASKYALLFALLSGGTGFVLVIKSIAQRNLKETAESHKKSMSSVDFYMK